jgi:hypothetical protein
MIIKILVGLVVIVVLFVVIVSLQLSDFRVARSATISAPPPAVFAQVNDFHKWETWNSWGKIDPAMKQIYDGATAGVGAIYTWVGNNEVGEGRMTLTESRPNELIRIKLEFFKPFAATNTAEFAFRAEGDRTTVTWSMDVRKNFVTKAMGLVMSMDRMVGGQFEKGLAEMKRVAEAGPGR